MFTCDKCGTCCRYHECKYLTEDNLCSMYEHRPDRCRVDIMAERSGMAKGKYYKLTKFACNMLRMREYLNNLVKTFFDGKYEEERNSYRRAK